MINYIIVTSDGQLLRSGTVQKKMLDTVEVPQGTFLIPDIIGYPGSETYFSTTEHKVKSMGKAPTPDHVFNYKTKQWHDPRTVEQKEIDKINKVKAVRAAEYPNIGDQLDALWKAMASNSKGLPAETTDMLAVIQTVKTKHPK